MSTRNGTSRSGRCEGDSITGGWRWRSGMPGSIGVLDKHDVLVADETGTELLAAGK